MNRTHNCLLILVLLRVQCSFCELRCDLSSMNVKILECVAYGFQTNYIASSAQEPEYNKAFRPIDDVHDVYTFDWTKPELSKINTVIIKDAKIKILDRDVFANSSVVNLDMSRNQNVKLESEMYTAFRGLHAVRLSGMNMSIPSREKWPPQYVGYVIQEQIQNILDKYVPLNFADLKNFHALEILDLSFNVLIDLAQFKIGNVLSSLNVSHTRVTLGDGCLDGADELKVLIMSHSGISTIPAGAFRGVELSHLDVSNNDVTEASLHSLTDSMTFVNLSHNCINDIQYTFKKSLEILDLSHNRITHLNSNTFTLIQKLFSLNLAHNQLSSLDSALLEEAQNLRSLDLSYNILTRFKLNIKSLKKLETLNLAGNQLKSLDRNIFVGNTALRVLLLRHNKLESLSVSTFSHLDRLRHLDVSDNYLKTLPDELLYTLNLETFSVSCNRLSNLPDNFFERNHNHMEVFNKKAFLYGNPWNCGCLTRILNATYVDRLYIRDGSLPSCYVGGSKVGNHASCDGDLLNMDDYIIWETALHASGMKCLKFK